MSSETHEKNRLYQGIPLVNKMIPQASFLVGEEGKEIVKAVCTDFKDYPVIADNFRYDEQQGVATGSNLFILAAVQHRLPAAQHVATLADLEAVVRIAPEALRGFYEDPALVLRSPKDSYEPNNFLAKDLARQLSKQDLPVMIPARYLKKPRKEGGSSYGLAFDIQEGADIIPAAVLQQAGRFSSTDVDESTGLFTKLDPQGDREHFNNGKTGGISGVLVGRNLDLDSNGSNLGVSYPDGRVVVVKSAAGAQKILEQCLAELEEENAKIVANAQARLKLAKDVLCGRE